MSSDAGPAPDEAGHRLVDHTADTRLEAWGPTRASCFFQAVLALVEGFADTAGVTPSTRSPVEMSGPDDDLLVDVLEEVVFLVDARGQVPVGGHLEDTDGGMAGYLECAPVDRVRPAGPVPKGVTYHGLEISGDENGWRCQVIVDV